MRSRSLSRMAMSSFDWRRVGPAMYGEGDSFGVPVPAPSESERDLTAGDRTASLPGWPAGHARRPSITATATSASASPSTSDIRDRSSMRVLQWPSSSTLCRRRRSRAVAVVVVVVVVAVVVAVVVLVVVAVIVAVVVLVAVVVRICSPFNTERGARLHSNRETWDQIDSSTITKVITSTGDGEGLRGLDTAAGVRCPDAASAGSNLVSSRETEECGERCQGSTPAVLGPTHRRARFDALELLEWSGAAPQRCKPPRFPTARSHLGWVPQHPTIPNLHWTCKCRGTGGSTLEHGE